MDREKTTAYLVNYNHMIGSDFDFSWCQLESLFYQVNETNTMNEIYSNFILFNKMGRSHPDPNGDKNSDSFIDDYFIHLWQKIVTKRNHMKSSLQFILEKENKKNEIIYK